MLHERRTRLGHSHQENGASVRVARDTLFEVLSIEHMPSPVHQRDVLRNVVVHTCAMGIAGKFEIQERIFEVAKILELTRQRVANCHFLSGHVGESVQGRFEGVYVIAIRRLTAKSGS